MLLAELISEETLSWAKSLDVLSVENPSSLIPLTSICLDQPENFLVMLDWLMRKGVAADDLLVSLGCFYFYSIGSSDLGALSGLLKKVSEGGKTEKYLSVLYHLAG